MAEEVEKTAKAELNSLKVVLMNRELLKMIGNYLSVKEQPRVRSVCRLWHNIFSENVLIKIKNWEELNEFCQFIKEKKLKNNQEVLYTKFDLSSWKINENCQNYSILEKDSISLSSFNMVISQLTEVVEIKELILPQMPIISAPIIKMIAPSIQVLNVDLPIMHFFEDNSIKKIPNIVPKEPKNEEGPIILEKLKKIIVRTRSDKEPTPRLWDLIEICPNMIYLEVFDLFINFVKVLDWIVEGKIKNLKTIKTEYLQYFDEKCLLTLGSIICRGLIKELKTPEFTLDISNIWDFCCILSMYKPGDLPEMNKNLAVFSNKNSVFYSNMKITSIYELDSVVQESIPKHKVLDHFPCLRNFKLTERGFGQEEENQSILSFENKSYPKITTLSYEFFNSISASTKCSKKICRIFPNLTVLKLKIHFDRLDLTPIFEKLTKLQELHFSGGKIGDEDFIGKIFTYFENTLQIKNYEQMIEKKDKLKVAENATIANLKNLRVLTFDKNEYLSDPPLSRKEILQEKNKGLVTEFSLYFAFRHIPNLNHLVLSLTSTHNIRVEYFTMFKDEFPQLRTLTIPFYERNFESSSIISELKMSRPDLKIEFFKCRGEDYQKECEYYKEEREYCLKEI